MMAGKKKQEPAQPEGILEAFLRAFSVGVEEALNVITRKKDPGDAAASVQGRLTPPPDPPPKKARNKKA